MPNKSVNSPTDPKTKEADVARKLQFYGIYSAFALGKVPSNDQIDVALNSAIQSDALNKPREGLSDESKALLGDLQNVISAAKKLLLSKNEGDLLQQFIWETQQITGADAKLPDAPLDKDTAKQHGNDLLNGVRTLGRLMITNGQFRKLLNDASILLRTMVGDAASKTAAKVQPSSEALDQLDKPAEDNVWHDDVDTQRLKEQAKGFMPFSKKDVEKAVQDSQPAGTQDSTGAFDPSQVDPDAAVDAAQNLKEQAKDSETANKLREQSRKVNARAKSYLETKMPKERREQTLWRLKKMVVEVQGHADYQEAIETLLRLAEEYSGHTKDLANRGQGTVQDVRSDGSLRKSENLLIQLLERFANGTSLKDLFNSINQIYRDADNDQEFREWFTATNKYIRRCLEEQGYIIQPLAQDEFNKLYDHGQYLFREKYSQHTDNVLNELKFLGTQFDKDPQNRAFADAVTTFFHNVGKNDSGKMAFKPHLIKDLTEHVLPAIFENVKYVPLPRMEYADKKVEFIIENLLIESDNLTPNSFEIETESKWKWGRKSTKSSFKNKFAIAVSGVQMDLRDVSFYFKSKGISDTGVADIFMGGDGLSFEIKMETREGDAVGDSKSRTHFFKVNDVKVKMKNFDVKLKHSKKKILFAMAKPVLLRLIQPAVRKVVESAIKQKAAELDKLLWEIHQEANQAKLDLKRNPDPENVKNTMQIYWSSANARFMKARAEAKEKAKKAEEKMEGKKFNMAMTLEDSIFPKIELPSGISTKATEYKKLAAEGSADRPWYSPVFSIGDSKKSTDIPRAPDVTQKHKGKATPQPGPSFEEAKEQEVIKKVEEELMIKKTQAEVEAVAKQVQGAPLPVASVAPGSTAVPAQLT